ncbi:Efflux pump [Venturia nashicola]|uniref:Efflux pump n=1 Tax=Venturia nashicola TaxID=86259 RepID=A0A4Z1NVA0_9PEZI|nr:Efflux pump [Venturia nashicola]TLD31698.1 Efflux pump [Venturia nashicola]
MFDVPDAKRVRRDELYTHSPSPSSSPDPSLGQAFLKSLGGDFTETFAATAHLGGGRPQSEELEFRLFARPSTSTEKTTTRIRIESPSRDNRPAGLVHPERPREHYFRDGLSPEAERRLKITAVSGEDVLAQSHTKWPGCSLPWRVTTILARGRPIQHHSVQSDTVKRKTRKGKKTRIAIRKKAVEARERKATAEVGAAEKELAERMKRAKRNRDKKLKKRERDKAKKTAVRAAGKDVAESSDDAESA